MTDTDYDDDYFDPDSEPDFGDSEQEQTEPSVSEEMLFALIKTAKEQQASVNAVLDRLTKLATTLEQGEQGRETRINTAIDDLKNLDLKGIVSDTTRQAVGELVNAELAKGVAQYIEVQNAKVAKNVSDMTRQNNIVATNLNSFAVLIDKLKDDETDIIQNNVAKQVHTGVIEGASSGLQDVSTQIKGYLDGIGNVVYEGASKLNKATSKADEVLDTITNYQERVINRKHWFLIGGVLSFLLLFIPLITFACYQMAISKMPSDEEIAQAQMQLKSLKEQNQYMQQALTTQQSAWKDNNLYLRVDRNKCTDINNQNYCMKQ